jgi:hypothetical protein
MHRPGALFIASEQMNLVDVFLGRAPSLEEAEEELGKPEMAEATDLKLHTERCAKRWLFSYRASKANSAQLAQLRLILLVMGITMLLTQPPIAKWAADHLFN